MRPSKWPRPPPRRAHHILTARSSGRAGERPDTANPPVRFFPESRQDLAANHGLSLGPDPPRLPLWISELRQDHPGILFNVDGNSPFLGPGRVDIQRLRGTENRQDLADIARPGVQMSWQRRAISPAPARREQAEQERCQIANVRDQGPRSATHDVPKSQLARAGSSIISRESTCSPSSALSGFRWDQAREYRFRSRVTHRELVARRPGRSWVHAQARSILAPRADRACDRPRSEPDRPASACSSFDRPQCAYRAASLARAAKTGLCSTRGFKGPTSSRRWRPRIQRSRNVTATRSQRVVLALIRRPFTHSRDHPEDRQQGGRLSQLAHVNRCSRVRQNSGRLHSFAGILTD